MHSFSVTNNESAHAAIETHFPGEVTDGVFVELIGYGHHRAQFQTMGGNDRLDSGIAKASMVKFVENFGTQIKTRASTNFKLGPTLVGY